MAGPMPLNPATISLLMARAAAQAELRAREGLIPVADMIKNQARTNASNGTHVLGTPTPSSGDPTGPARISAALVGSIDRSEPNRVLTGWEILVGTSRGVFSSYNPKVPTSRYGLLLETTGAGRSRHRFPFLEPAVNFAVHVGVAASFKIAFSAPWSF